MAVILLRSRRRCRRISPISLSFMVFPRLYVEMPGHYITSKRKNPVKIEGGRFRPPSSGYISGSALALQSLMVMRGVGVHDALIFLIRDGCQVFFHKVKISVPIPLVIIAAVSNTLYRNSRFVFHLIIGTAASAGTLAPVLQNISSTQIKRTSAQNFPRGAV